MTYGATDDLGVKAIDKRMSVHDLHATILHLMGINHKRLTYRYSGRDFRLTDVYGEVAHEIIASNEGFPSRGAAVTGMIVGCRGDHGLDRYLRIRQRDRAFDRIAAFAKNLALHRRCVADAGVAKNVADIRRAECFETIETQRICRRR